MLLRHLFISLVFIALIALYITIPVSHRAITGWPSRDAHHQAFVKKNRNSNNDNDNDHQSLASSEETKSPEQEGNHHYKSSSSVKVDFRNSINNNNNNKPTQFPKIIPEQMEPTQLSLSEKRGEFKNPYKPLIDDDSTTLSLLMTNKSSKLKKCTRLKYTQGKWVKREKPPRPMYPALGEILGCCERGFQKELLLSSKSSESSSTSSSSPKSPSSSSSIRDELLYEWIPDECDLIPWSEELFCKALRGRDIMFAGDSLNDHWHASLYYLLGGKKDIYKYEGTIGGKKRCKGHPICAKYYKKPLKLHHLTNQYLSESSLRNRNYKWWRPIRKYPILVLNSGSWMRDVFDERVAISDDKWRNLMVKALGLVRREEFNGTIIWRTTYSGHPFCWNYTKPLDRPLSGSEFPDVHPYNKYRWDTIPERNKFTTNLWTKAGAHILDVERVTNMMPLGHLGKNHPKFATKNATDCLHYCSPGPVYDTWSQLLMNLLLGNFEEDAAVAAAAEPQEEEGV